MATHGENDIKTTLFKYQIPILVIIATASNKILFYFARFFKFWLWGARNFFYSTFTEFRTLIPGLTGTGFGLWEQVIFRHYLGGGPP